MKNQNQKKIKSLRQFKNAQQRRKYLEKELGISLNFYGQGLIDDEKNIFTENLIGAVSVPLGIVGPIKVKSSKLKVKSCYLPLATTEGALVASVSRGIKAINNSGGAIIKVEKIGTTRGSVFQTRSLDQTYQAKQWLENNFFAIKQQAEKTSSHIKLLTLQIYPVGSYLFIRFTYDCQLAMGMNMATIATEKAIQFISQKLKIKSLSLAGNYDIDKKPAWINFILGRGLRVEAQAVIKKLILEKVLKTNAQAIFETWLAKCMIGSSISGSIGFNSHYANIVAAFFTATGQDIAHTVEGSIGITTTKVIDKDSLEISVMMPDIMLGMIGGGTGLSGQKQGLRLTNAKTPAQLAGVLAIGVLAGELSLLASLSQGSLASSHQKLGR